MGSEDSMGQEKEIKLTSLHRTSYGRYNDHPDPEKCCVEVWEQGRSFSHYQCRRKRGYGPEGAYCKQHSPEEQKKRDEKSREKYQKGVMRRRLVYGAVFYSALVKIAEGHNDPRALAEEVIAPYRKKDDKV